MPLAQITIREEEEGAVNLTVEFEPPVQNKDDAEPSLTCLGDGGA